MTSAEARSLPAPLAGVAAGRRMTDDEALALLSDGDLLSLGAAAHAARLARHPEPVVTFLIDTNLNYTNVCVANCSFCAFYREARSSEGYLHAPDLLVRKVKAAQQQGATQVILQGGLHPEIRLPYYVELLSTLKRETGIHLHAFSPPEILHLARQEAMPVRELLARLRAAGMDSMPGGGAEILDDEVRQKISPMKLRSDEWLSVMRDAHAIGLSTTATMMYGTVEEDRHVVNHLRKIRALQDETSGFTAFIPWDFQPENTFLRGYRRGTGVRYLKVVAISRLYLDNVAAIQASWLTQGVKLAQVALRFGANDIGSTLIEENVLNAAGVTNRASAEDLARAIRDAGFTPAQRNHWYQILRTFP